MFWLAKPCLLLPSITMSPAHSQLSIVFLEKRSLYQRHLYQPLSVKTCCQFSCILFVITGFLVLAFEVIDSHMHCADWRKVGGASSDVCEKYLHKPRLWCRYTRDQDDVLLQWIVHDHHVQRLVSSYVVTLEVTIPFAHAINWSWSGWLVLCIDVVIMPIDLRECPSYQFVQKPCVFFANWKVDVLSTRFSKRIFQRIL